MLSGAALFAGRMAPGASVAERGAAGGCILGERL
jgi:hypothetical protein